MHFSNSTSCELVLKHEGANADKDSKYKKIFQYPLLSFQIMAIFQMTMAWLSHVKLLKASLALSVLCMFQKSHR